MSKFKFLFLFLFTNLFFIFLKIYQQNCFIKLIYQKQRVDIIKNNLKKEKNDLFAQLSQIKEKEKIFNIANKDMEMKLISMSQVITNTVNKF